MEKLWINPPTRFADALKMAQDPVALVRHLLAAATGGSAASREENGFWFFEAKPDSEGLATELKLSPSNVLTGSSVDAVEKVYLVVREIETELDGVTFLPPEMRKEKIAELCARVGVPADVFDLIIRNWRKP